MSMRNLLLSGCLAVMSNLHLLAECLLKLHPGCEACSSLSTAHVVAGTVDFLRSLELDKDALTKAIIGTIGDIDSYQLPDAKGHTAFMRHLLKVTEEERQQRREQVTPAVPAAPAAGTVHAATALLGAETGRSIVEPLKACNLCCATYRPLAIDVLLPDLLSPACMFMPVTDKHHKVLLLMKYQCCRCWTRPSRTSGSSLMSWSACVATRPKWWLSPLATGQGRSMRRSDLASLTRSPRSSDTLQVAA